MSSKPKNSTRWMDSQADAATRITFVYVKRGWHPACTLCQDFEARFVSLYFSHDEHRPSTAIKYNEVISSMNYFNGEWLFIVSMSTSYIRYPISFISDSFLLYCCLDKLENIANKVSFLLRSNLERWFADIPAFINKTHVYVMFYVIVLSNLAI